MLAQVFQAILDFFGTLISSFVSALPESPFRQVSGSLGMWASWLNYFVPVGQMVSMLAAYTGAVAIWYGVRWILRFARYIN